MHMYVFRVGPLIHVLIMEFDCWLPMLVRIRCLRKEPDFSRDRLGFPARNPLAGDLYSQSCKLVELGRWRCYDEWIPLAITLVMASQKKQPQKQYICLFLKKTQQTNKQRQKSSWFIIWHLQSDCSKSNTCKWIILDVTYSVIYKCDVWYYISKLKV